jgi:uncharacterized protein DUF6600
MRSFGFASLLGSIIWIAAPARAQVGSPVPARPYAGPAAPNQSPSLQDGDFGQPGAFAAGDGYGADAQAALPIPTAEDPGSAAAAPENQVYDPAQQAVYPEPDLGPDEQIADTYDDGYDPQAYQQFQTSLAPYGSWVNDDSYGYVWSPSAAVVGAGFVPYGTNGHWVLSEYGWTWVSDWNWGWAPFHYGRWTMLGGRGWCWVPGTMWGPAWVSWRSGGGYVGWAALPPRGARLFAGAGARSPWRFTAAAGLGATRPAFYGGRSLPSLFARTSVVANDRLLTRGSWAVHVNAGPTRGYAAPVRLAGVAPHALPRVTVYPRQGIAIAARPWARVGGSTAVWRAGMAEPRPVAGRAQSFATGNRASMPTSGTVWSRPAMAAGAGSSARSYGGSSLPSAAARPQPVQPSYGYGRAQPATRPQPNTGGYRPQSAEPAYHPQTYAPAAPRTYAPAPAYGGGHFGGGSSFGGGNRGGGSFGGGSHLGGGGRRR